jgi:hypothetical protein
MNRNIQDRRMRNLAQQLLAREAAAHNPADVNVPAMLRVLEALRRLLSTLTGASGFRAVMGRALVLAKAQDPDLSAVHLKPDGSLEDLSKIRNHEDPAAGIELIAQLLGLLATLIGESLTLRIVLDTWPDLTVVDAEPSGESEDDPTK